MARIKVVERDEKLIELEVRLKLAALELMQHAECGGFSLELPGLDADSHWIVVGVAEQVRDLAENILSRDVSTDDLLNEPGDGTGLPLH